MIKSRINLIDKIQDGQLYSGLGRVLVAALLTLPSSGWAGVDDSPAVDWGRDLYMSYCVSCHGWTGKGDGPAGLALKSPPADLTKLSARNGGEFPATQVKRYIEGEALIQAHGSRKMPVWGKVFRRESTGSEARMQYFALVKFLESIQVKE
ncbi:MAG: cytochrome c [Candidatus Reddybacter sp.]